MLVMAVAMLLLRVWVTALPGSPLPTGRLLTAANVGTRYQVPTRSVYSWVDQGLLPARRCGKRLLRFSLEDLVEFERRSGDTAP